MHASCCCQNVRVKTLLPEPPLPAAPLPAMEVCGSATRMQHWLPSLFCGGAAQPAIGEAIVRARPSAVVVETAVNPAHGAATGNALRTDAHARLADTGLRRLCMAAAQLAAEPDPCASRLFAVRPKVGVAVVLNACQKDMGVVTFF